MRGVRSRSHRGLKQEKKDIRLAILPLLQAEEDARFVVKVCCLPCSCLRMRCEVACILTVVFEKYGVACGDSRLFALRSEMSM